MIFSNDEIHFFLKVDQIFLLVTATNSCHFKDNG